MDENTISYITLETEPAHLVKFCPHCFKVLDKIYLGFVTEKGEVNIMDPVEVTVVSNFETPWGNYAVVEVKAPGFTPGADFTSETKYTWTDPEKGTNGQSNVPGYGGVVDDAGNAVYYGVVGPVTGGTLEGTVKEHSATFSQVVNF